MAFVSNMPDDEEKTNQPNGGQGPVSPTGTGGGVHLAPSSAVAPGGGGSASANGPATAGGSFASLDKYISANQGQAAPLAGKLTNGINQQYNTLQGQNASTLSDIGNQVSASAVPADSSATLAQEAANPVSFSGDTGNVGKFQGLLNATYSGPASAEGTSGFSTQQNAVNNAIASGQAATQTEAGRKGLLQQNEAAPTTGVTALNSAILSQDPNALKSIEGAYQPFNNLLTGLSTGAQAIDKNIATTQSGVTSANQAANKQINDQISALNSNVNKEYSDLQGQYKTANDTAAGVASSLQNGTLPSGMGVDPRLSAYIQNQINPWAAENLPGQTASYNFANAVPTFQENAAPTLEQAATPQEYQQAQAFQNLLSGLNTGAPTPILNPSTATQAGTYKTEALPTVNNNLLAGDIAAGVGSLNGDISSRPYSEFQRYNNMLAALSAYQGQWTPQYGAEPQKGTSQWADWAMYHGGPNTASTQGLEIQ